MNMILDPTPSRDLLLDTDWEQIGICILTPLTAWSRIKCLGELICLLTYVVLAINCLALVSNSRQPTAILTVLHGRVQPPRSPRHARQRIRWELIGASVRKGKGIGGTLFPILHHKLSPVIGALLTTLAVVGLLGRNIAAFLSNVVSSNPAGELAVALSRGALSGAASSTGIADRVPSQHFRRSVVVAEDAPRLIFGLLHDLNGGFGIRIARGGCYFACGLGIFLCGMERRKGVEG